MSKQKVMSVELHPVLDELPRLVSAVEMFAEEQGVGAGDAMALTMALEELFTNTVRHGGAGATVVGVVLEREGDAVTAVYSDAGRAFDTAGSAVDGGLHTGVAVETRPVGGLGLHMIQATMERFGYERREGRNVTTIVRRLGGKKLARSGPSFS